MSDKVGGISRIDPSTTAASQQLTQRFEVSASGEIALLKPSVLVAFVLTGMYV